MHLIASENKISNRKKIRKISEFNHLFFHLHFTFYSVLNVDITVAVFVLDLVSNLNFVGFTLLKFLDHFLLDFYGSNTLLVGFGLIGFTLEFEDNFLTLDSFAVGPFEFCFNCKGLFGFLDLDDLLDRFQGLFYDQFVCGLITFVFGYKLIGFRQQFDFQSGITVLVHLCNVTYTISRD